MKKPPSAQKSAKSGVVDSNDVQSLTSEGVVGAGAELHLELPGFEGPFDLLLHLIHEHQLDILNIPVAFVTDKYLHYLSLMQELNIDVASEYLVMAATLAHIKSRMLLPTPPADEEADGDESELDPRGDLIRRLLEYQKYKQVAEELASRSVLGRDVFTRGAAPEIVEGPAPLAPLGIFKLLEAFQRILVRANTVLDHQIEFERLSITDRINQLVDRLRTEGRLSFDALFEGQRTRAELIVTFLALLEMTRLRLTNIRQDAALAPITVELAVADSDAAREAAEAYPGERKGAEESVQSNSLEATEVASALDGVEDASDEQSSDSVTDTLTEERVEWRERETSDSLDVPNRVFEASSDEPDVSAGSECLIEVREASSGLEPDDGSVPDESEPRIAESEPELG
jgi:segregation and condensation protein A